MDRLAELSAGEVKSIGPAARAPAAPVRAVPAGMVRASRSRSVIVSAAMVGCLEEEEAKAPSTTFPPTSDGSANPQAIAAICGIDIPLALARKPVRMLTAPSAMARG